VFYHCIFDAMIHTTIGLYPNGEYKVNGVSKEDLEAHIEYNKTMRFGRALFVDGELVYKGMGCETAIEGFKEKAKEIKMKKVTKPYK